MKFIIDNEEYIGDDLGIANNIVFLSEHSNYDSFDMPVYNIHGSKKYIVINCKYTTDMQLTHYDLDDYTINHLSLCNDIIIHDYDLCSNIYYNSYGNKFEDYNELSSNIKIKAKLVDICETDYIIMLKNRLISVDSNNIIRWSDKSYSINGVFGVYKEFITKYSPYIIDASKLVSVRICQ